MEIFELASEIVERAGEGERFIVAVAGPPGSGKSTLAEQLVTALNQASEQAVLLPMDGYHLDNCILKRDGILERKGAPETFDFGGFQRVLSAICARETVVYTPVFDRALDLARGGGQRIDVQHRIVITEGNYLLLDKDPWRDLTEMFDLSIFIEVDEGELERRLVQRWLDHDHDAEAAARRVSDSDMVNAKLVNRSRLPADIVFT